MRQVTFPAKFQPFFRPRRYKVARGGRGSGKSWSVARALVLLGSQRPLRIMCGREYQKSIEDSVLALLEDQISDLKLTSFYTVQKNVIYGKNGTQFKFAGVKTNPSSIKSFEGIDIFWMEEAEKVSKRSWEIVIPTVRKDGSEIWITYNPDEEDDPTHAMVNQLAKENASEIALVEMSWMDNPWFPGALRKEKDYAYRVDSESADNVWGGNTRRRKKAAILFDKVVQDTRVVVHDPFPDRNWHGPYDGADWGFSTDPLTAVRCWISPDLEELYLEHESYGVGVENDDIAPKWRQDVPGIGNVPILADNSRPETISYVKKKGHLPVRAADKWQGSVEDGITYLRNFVRIVIHPRCKHAWQEAKDYSYRVDKLSGLVTSDIVDAHNHIWDAVRYALQKMIRNKTSLMDHN